jgi:hypothetical protein
MSCLKKINTISERFKNIKNVFMFVLFQVAAVKEVAKAVDGKRSK